MERILIVEDNKDMQFLLSHILEEEGYKTSVAGNGKKALKKIEEITPNLVVLDVRMPKMDGFEVLEKVKKINPEIQIIMITAYGEIRDSVKAMKLGAYDYITKPFDNDEIIFTIKKALKNQSLKKEVEELRKRLKDKDKNEIVVGESSEIQYIMKQVNLIAPTNMIVIIQGKSGTGKEVFAKMIHQKSKRNSKPFIAIDCGAIPDTLIESELFGHEEGAFTGASSMKKGKFELAEGGTLFFDEITNLSESGQKKLLRAIEENEIHHIGGKKSIPVDVRIIVAANSDLSEAVQKNEFRDDLFYRLNQFNIPLPLLHERKDDIPTLAKEFLSEANIELDKNVRGFSSKAMRLLQNYHWPGNIRELKHVVKRATLICKNDYIHPECFPKNLSRINDEIYIPEVFESNFSMGNVINDVEKNMVLRALDLAEGSKTKAADYLKITRKSLYRKMRKFEIPFKWNSMK